MELTDLVSNLPVVLIPVALIVYYSYQKDLKWMAERKELIEAILEERKEWLDWQRGVIDRQFANQDRNVDAISTIKAEMHALRGRIQEFLSTVQNGITQITVMLQKMSGNH